MTSETPVLDLWYCKSLKSTGKPIMVREFNDGKAKVRNTDRWQKTLYDDHGNKYLLRIHYKNTTGKPKSQGATSMLEIVKVDV